MNQFIFLRRVFPALISMLILSGSSCIGVSALAQQTDVEAESARIWVGKKVKAFILPGVDGKPVNIADNLGKRPIVIVFYRGVW